MKVKYTGGRRRLSGGKILKSGDVLEWEGPLVMGMVPFEDPIPTSELHEQKKRWVKPVITTLAQSEEEELDGA